MFGVYLSRPAILLASERSLALYRGSTAWNFTIPHAFKGSRLRFASRLRNGARRYASPHVAPIALIQRRVGIRHTLPMNGIMHPDGGSMHVSNMGSIEIIAMNEGIVDDHGVVAPARMPAPTPPAMPTAAEE